MLGFTNFTRRAPREAQGGGSPKVEIRSLKQKKCIFWLKMAVSVVPAPPPGAPPDVVKKKLSTFSKKYLNIDRGGFKGGLPDWKKRFFAKKKSYEVALEPNPSPPCSPPWQRLPYSNFLDQTQPKTYLQLSLKMRRSCSTVAGSRNQLDFPL